MILVKTNISGLILKKITYIKELSIIFYTILSDLSNWFDTNNKISSTAFIFSNLVKASGIELFAEAMIQNCYLE